MAEVALTSRVRTLYRRLRYRKVPFGLTAPTGRFAGMDQIVSVDRWERWLESGYQFEIWIRKPDSDWEKVGVPVEQIRDEKGRLTALRIDEGKLFGDNPSGVEAKTQFWIDGPTLRKRKREP